MTQQFERMFSAPTPHPNGLQGTREGLWIADQDGGHAFLVDPESGSTVRSFGTGAGKTSGVAFGHSALWMCSNGMPVTRVPGPHDTDRTRIVKTDTRTGAMLAQIRVPADSDVHGLEWTPEGLWLTTLDQQALTVVDSKSFTPLRSFPVPMERAHGLAWDGRSLWCAFTTERVLVRFNTLEGSEVGRIALGCESFEPHGLTIWGQRLWISDASTGEVYRGRDPV